MSRFFRYASLCFCLFVPAVVFAQTPARDYSVAARIGANYATMVDPDFKNGFSTRRGITGGVSFGWQRASRVGLGLDLMYARKGTIETGGTLDMDYIDVPVYARVNVTRPDASGVASVRRPTVYGIAGLNVATLILARIDSTGLTLTKELKRLDYGATLGLGVEISRVVVEARFTQGIFNLVKDTSKSELRTRGVALTAGWRFH